MLVAKRGAICVREDVRSGAKLERRLATGLVAKRRCEVRNWRCARRNARTLVTIDPGDFKGNNEGPGEIDDEGVKTRRARRRR